jgi:hypothetical protein
VIWRFCANYRQCISLRVINSIRAWPRLQQFIAHGPSRNDIYPQVSPLTKHRLGIYFARAEVCAKETPPMSKVIEVLLTVVALAGLYSAIPASIPPPGNSAIRAEQAVVVADGSDPMPLCRARVCK